MTLCADDRSSLDNLSDMLELHEEGAMHWPRGLSPIIAEQLSSLLNESKPHVCTTKAMKAQDVLCVLEAFITCPLSKKRYVDPVFCIADEQTYERTYIESLIRLGPNSITGQTSPLSKTFNDQADLIPNHLVRFLIIASQRLQAMVEMTEGNSCTKQGDAFTCPLTLGAIVEPMITPSGHTYSGLAIRKCVDRCGFSPQTKQRLRADQLVPNRALKEAMEESQRKDAVIDKLKSIAKMLAARAPQSTSSEPSPTPKRRRLLKHVTV